MPKQKLKGFKIKSGNVVAEIHLDAINNKLDRAQYALDSQVMTDMVPLMPQNTGDFVNRTRATSASLAGSGVVCAGEKPFGRYLYEGKVMVDSKTGKGPANIPNVGLRFQKGAKLVETDRPLNYSNPNAVPHWFDVAKEKHLDDWVDVVKKEVGGK